MRRHVLSDIECVHICLFSYFLRPSKKIRFQKGLVAAAPLQYHIFHTVQPSPHDLRRLYIIIIYSIRVARAERATTVNRDLRRRYNIRKVQLPVI